MEAPMEHSIVLVTGPIEAQRQPHLHDRASQEAAWQAVVKVSGVDFPSASLAVS